MMGRRPGVLTGGSTGGWNVLALQIHYSDVFGGAWSLYPDQLDFRNYQFGNTYADTNAFVQADGSRTGTIDRAVAESMRARGYDLRDHLERNWSALGPKLVGKLHVAAGDMDNFFLNLGVYRFETFLEGTRAPGKGPYYAGPIEYGRPLKPHGWQPWTNQELLRMMKAHIERNATTR